MKIGDEVLYYTASNNTDPIRVGKVVDIVSFKSGVKFLIIKNLHNNRTISRRKEMAYALNSIEQLKQDITQRRNNGIKYSKS